MRHIEGRCLCGKTTYSADAEPTQTFNCHCKDCQRQTGSAFASAIAIDDSTFQAAGHIGTFRHLGGSGATIDRSFCKECGSPLFSKISERPGMVYIKVGTLNDAHWVKPEFDLWCDSAQPWVQMDPILSTSPMGFKFAVAPLPAARVAAVQSD